MTIFWFIVRWRVRSGTRGSGHSAKCPSPILGGDIKNWWTQLGSLALHRLRLCTRGRQGRASTRFSRLWLICGPWKECNDMLQPKAQLILVVSGLTSPFSACASRCKSGCGFLVILSSKSARRTQRFANFDSNPFPSYIYNTRMMCIFS